MQIDHRSVPILSTAVVLSLAVVASLVTSTLVASKAYVERGHQVHREARTLDVTGSTRIRIESDLALWAVRVVGEGKTLAEAYERLASSLQHVRDFLAQKQFPEASLAVGAIDTTKHFARDAKGNETREVLSYQLVRLVEVRSPDVGKVSRAAGEASDLLKKGAHVESCSPRYIYTKLADLKIRVQAEATANARERAETIARESRCRVGAVREARAGVLQITPPWSTDVSSSGINDTSTIEKDVQTTVRLTVMIEPD